MLPSASSAVAAAPETLWTRPALESDGPPANLPPRLRVKLPTPELISDRFNSQSSPLATLMVHDSVAPMVRLRPSAPAFLPNNPHRTPMNDLHYDDRTGFWGIETDEKAWDVEIDHTGKDHANFGEWKTNEKAWTDASFSSDDSSTDTSSSALPNAGAVAAQLQDYLQPRALPSRPLSVPEPVANGYVVPVGEVIIVRIPPRSCWLLSAYGPPVSCTTEPPISLPIHDHTRVTIGAGFDVLDVTTGVENPWVVLGNIPAQVKLPAIRKVLSAYGTVEDVKMPKTLGTKEAMVVKARFSCHAEALRATAALDGTPVFRSKISARIPVNSRSGTVSITDNTLRIQWEAPQRIAYASVHEGIPSIGAVTVKFTNLPPDADEELLRQIGHPPADVMWERPNYLALDPAVDGVRSLLRSLDAFLDMEVVPPPYSAGLIRAWARFSSAAAAKSAATSLHGRKPLFIGKKRIFAHHIQSLEYDLTSDAYTTHAGLVEQMRAATARNGYSRSVIIRHSSPQSVRVKLSSESISELGFLKAEFEKILRGEVLRSDGVDVWDGFFGRDAGSSFLRQVERNTGSRIEVDPIRRHIKVFGTPPIRAAARNALLQQITQLKAQQTRKIHVLAPVLNNFITTQLGALCRMFGVENISSMFGRGRLHFGAADDLYQAGTEAIHEAQQSPPRFFQLFWVSGLLQQVCRTNHSAMWTHVVSQLSRAEVMGNATSLFLSRQRRAVLSPNEFNMVIDAALSSYVHTHAKDLHHCPSPDCLQIYRTGPQGTVVQCPACLLRICAYCHVEAHDGFSCAEQDGGDRLFKEWAAGHDVKNCPGCMVPIERDEGCHHVTCSQCRTHICWVCLRTFPNGDGIYQHMRAEHGGIGLVPQDA
ncbi:hypothetical protein C8F01DRAFT_1306744 [Mycena amicta]|nr:hypothetical protein C8F01DRAFT_1306744 [Mycena amicta]